MLDHLAQAGGRARHCDICNFTQGVALQLGERCHILYRHRNAVNETFSGVDGSASSYAVVNARVAGNLHH